MEVDGRQMLSGVNLLWTQAKRRWKEIFHSDTMNAVSLQNKVDLQSPLRGLTRTASPLEANRVVFRDTFYFRFYLALEPFLTSRGLQHLVLYRGCFRKTQREIKRIRGWDIIVSRKP